MKQAEDGNGFILRAYETDGKAVRAALSLPFLSAETEADFRPHEVKTLRIASDGAVSETNILEDFPEPADKGRPDVVK